MAKKLLFILPADNKWSRLIRRGVVIGFLTAVAIIIKEGVIPIAPEAYIILFTAILATLDKLIRTLQEK